MAKLTLADATTTGYKVTTTINANNSFIEAAMENTLSRDGTGPNAMGADLDMNSNFITNLSTPTLSSHAATKGYVDGIVTTLVTLNETGVSVFGLSLLDDANAAEARTTLGLGTAATSDTGDFAAASHTHATTDITSGTFADARIAQTNVTQHQAALSINSSQTNIEVSSETTGTLTSASFYKIVNVSASPLTLPAASAQAWILIDPNGAAITVNRQASGAMYIADTNAASGTTGTENLVFAYSDGTDWKLSGNIT